MNKIKSYLASIFYASLLISTVAVADEVSVKKKLLSKYSTLDSALVVKKVEGTGLYEVNLQGREGYTNDSVDFLLIGGSLIETKTLKDLTAERKPFFLRDFYKSIPKDQAIKLVYGNGAREFVAFEDPDCPVCKAQHQIWAKDADKFNATVYVFMLPLSIHPDATRKAEYLLCQQNPAAAWKSWMESGQGMPLDSAGKLKFGDNCPAGVKLVQSNEKFARSFGYRSTPRFIFTNGQGVGDALELQQFNELFEYISKEDQNLMGGNHTTAVQKPQKVTKP